MSHARIVPMFDAPEPTEAPAFTFQGPWFSYAEAAAYVGCRTLNAWYCWRKRHGIIARTNHTVAKRDLDRVLLPKQRRPRAMAPASLANLRGRA